MSTQLVDAAGERRAPQLMEDAAEIREIAGKLRAAAAAAAAVLDRVARMDTPATWDGPWARDCGTTVAAWRARSQASAAALARRATVLDAYAAVLDDRAAAARAAR